MAKKGKTITDSISVTDAMQEGVSELQDLANEMSEWRDNLEEKLSHTEKFERVSECADVLESASSAAESTAQELDAVLTRAACSVIPREGCPKHVAKTPCARCGWDGEPTPGVPLDSPELLSLKAVVFAAGEEPGYFGRVGNAWYHSEERFIEARNEADAIYNRRTSPTLPKEKPARLAEDRLFEEDVLLKTFPVQRFVPYAGRSKSRADRRNEATDLLLAAAATIIEQVDDWESARDTEREARDGGIEPQLTDAEERAEEDLRQRVEEIRAYADDLTQHAEEASDADFPGMYG